MLTRTSQSVELDGVVSEAEPDHLVLVAERGGQLIGIAQYDRVTGSDVAEVAFVVDDAHQGLGIGTLLLEYLASEGRRNGLKRFAADILLENNAMVQVFRDCRVHATLGPRVRGDPRRYGHCSYARRRSLRCTSGTAKRRHVRWPACCGLTRSPS